MTDPLKIQHGGTHYKGTPIQPIEFAVANGYDAAAFSTLKYISRHMLKNGRECVLKGRHFVEIRYDLMTQPGGQLLLPFEIAPAQDVITIDAYLEANKLGTHESAILRNLHTWAQNKTPFLSDATCAALILQQIDHLLETFYPQPKD